MNTDEQTQAEAVVQEAWAKSGFKALTLSEYNDEYGPDLKGRIVYYEEPLEVSIYTVTDKGEGMMPIASASNFGVFQLVEGGFGANLQGHGRMIMGPFYKELKDAKADNRFEFSDEQREQLLDMVPRGSVGRVKGFKLSEATKETPSRVLVPLGGEQ
jgi:hypothetical protein